jgi:hypothetical protein
MNRSELKKNREVGEKRKLSYPLDRSIKKAESDLIEEQTASFLACGGKVTEIEGYGVQSTCQHGYGNVVIVKPAPIDDEKKAKRNFTVAARSCFARGLEDAAIYVFKNDNGFHFRNNKERAPKDSELVKKFKSMKQVLAFKLPKA